MAHKTSPKMLDSAERRRAVLTLRKGGLTYREIAETMEAQFGLDALPKGWDDRYACKDVMRELARIREEIAESATDILMLELQRLDEAHKNIWKRVLKGDLGAVDRMLKIMERRAKLLGLEAPTKVEQRSEITGKGGGPVQVESTGLKLAYYEMPPEEWQAVEAILQESEAMSGAVSAD